MRRSRSTRLTQRGAAFLTSGAILTAGGVFLGQPDLTRVGILLLALLVGSAALGRLRPVRMTVQRVLEPPQVAVDGPARVRLSLRNDAPRRSPLLAAHDEVGPALGENPQFLVTPIGVGESAQIDYPLRPRARGLHPLGPVWLWLRDPFGLTCVTAAAPGTAALLVTPRIHPLTAYRPLGAAQGSEGTLAHRIALRGEEDQAIRDYREGDDLRRIHWPATARTGSLMVRQEDRPAQRRSVILFDNRRAAHSGSSFEWFVSMAASIGAHAAAAGYAVHLLTPDVTVDARVRSDDALPDLVATLARIVPSRDDGFPSVLHAASSSASTGGLLVALVSGLDEPTAGSLAALRQHGSLALALVHLPDTGAASITQARRTLATLGAAGWLTAAIDARQSPAQVWEALTHGRVGERS